MSKSCSGANSLVLALALTACADGPTAAEKKAADDRAVAKVEAVQKQRPPPRMLEPEPILFGDIQRFSLFGAGCAFAPGGSLGAVLLTREKVAYLKLQDRMVRFASDPGSAKLPLGTVSRYVGKEFAAALTRADGEDGEAVRFAGHLTITNPFDQVVYDADGLIQCGA